VPTGTRDHTQPANRYGETYIASYPDTELRHAVWSHNGQFIADFDGPEEQAIAWAGERSDESWLWSPADDDYHRISSPSR
jgi:hypothetical protein